MRQSLSIFPICAMEISFDLAEEPGYPSCQSQATCEVSTGDCHLTYLPQWLRNAAGTQPQVSLWQVRSLPC